jgi:hypothetical protein
MKWLNSLTTRTRLFFGLAAMVILLAGVIAAAYRGFSEGQKSQDRVQREMSFVLDLVELRNNFIGTRAAVLETLVSERSQWGRLLQDIRARSEENNQLMRQMLERARDDPALRAKVEEIATILDAYKKTRDNQQIPLLDQGKLDELKSLTLGVQEDRYGSIRAQTHNLQDERIAIVEGLMKDGQASTRNYGRAFLAIGLVGLLVALGLALFMNQIVAAREKVLEEIREAVAVLSSSTAEIVAATTQLASSAVEAASAVSETTTTVEEVRQTTQLSSKKAKEIADAGQHAAQVLQNGRQNVDESVAEMNHIREQMSAIGQTIMLLSEQSQAIGEITGTVNELAEQSNLLAVNAAIEAAKAGEQGKGFAVVAQEIKSMAEQSKQATAQVRNLLADIQKAIGNAVMAAEQASKVVESGVMQSGQAGESIRAAVEATVSAANASTQIAASSQQQLVGVDQVATAMENINQSSAQNAESTRQVETVAQNLHALGQKLRELIEAKV